MSLAVSLLAAKARDRAEMIKTARQIDAAGAAVHVDLMDATVTRGVGIDLEILADLTAVAQVEVHLMVADLDTMLATVLRARPARAVVHPSWVVDFSRIADRLVEAGVATWVGVGPGQSFLPDRALATTGVVVVALTPGAQDETLRTDTTGRLRRFAGPWSLGVDGGVDPGNAPQLIAAGASHLISGRAIFAAPSVLAGVQTLRRSASDGA